MTIGPYVWGRERIAAQADGGIAPQTLYCSRYAGAHPHPLSVSVVFRVFGSTGNNFGQLELFHNPYSLTSSFSFGSFSNVTTLQI